MPWGLLGCFCPECHSNVSLGLFIRPAPRYRVGCFKQHSVLHMKTYYINNNKTAPTSTNAFLFYTCASPPPPPHPPFRSTTTLHTGEFLLGSCNRGRFRFASTGLVLLRCWLFFFVFRAGDGHGCEGLEQVGVREGFVRLGGRGAGGMGVVVVVIAGIVKG